MKKHKFIYYLPTIISITLILALSIFIDEWLVNVNAMVVILLFGVSGFLMNKGCLIGIIVGIIPAIPLTFYGLQDRGQWVNELYFAVPIYIFYIMCGLYIIINKKINKNDKISI